jgi:signal transduction histidine kinase
MLEWSIILSMFGLICLMILFFILFVVFYNKKFIRLENSYERIVAKVRQEVQQTTLNNLSFDIIETFGNNLFAIRCNLVGGVLDPLQKITEDINQGFSNPSQTEQTAILQQVLHSVTAIQKNVLDTKKPVEDMNTDVLKACEKLRTNFAENTLVKNFELEIQRFTGYDIIKNFTGAEYPLIEHKKMLLFWVFQLAMNNIKRHSHATQIHLELSYEPSSVRICIQDNGVGFDPADLNKLRKKGQGIDNMYTAARMINAELSITARPGMGAILTISLQTLPI